MWIRPICLIGSVSPLDNKTTEGKGKVAAILEGACHADSSICMRTRQVRNESYNDAGGALFHDVLERLPRKSHQNKREGGVGGRKGNLWAINDNTTMPPGMKPRREKLGIIFSGKNNNVFLVRFIASERTLNMSHLHCNEIEGNLVWMCVLGDGWKWRERLGEGRKKIKKSKVKR